MSRRLVHSAGLVGARCAECGPNVSATIWSKQGHPPAQRGSEALLRLSCRCGAVRDLSECIDPRAGRGTRAQRSAIERLGMERIAVLRRTPKGEVAPGTIVPPKREARPLPPMPDGWRRRDPRRTAALAMALASAIRMEDDRDR